jgi:hypothetical protein
MAVKLSMIIYKAGACLPFPDPFGCREQEFAVRLVRVENFDPQYLQTYCDFSLPS